MKNSTLLFRSLAIVILIAGCAHLVTYASKNSGYNYKTEETTTEDIISENEKTYDQNTDFITGKWKVTYNSKAFKGSIVYEIKKEGSKFNAYTSQYLDEKGNTQKAEGDKALIIKSFDGYRGDGTYRIEHEGEIYNVECTINMLDENTFELKYDYYGYSDIETWKRN